MFNILKIAFACEFLLVDAFLSVLKLFLSTTERFGTFIILFFLQAIRAYQGPKACKMEVLVSCSATKNSSQ